MHLFPFKIINIYLNNDSKLILETKKNHVSLFLRDILK